jgi:flagellar biosynthesis/type III secretory pathway chaperone
MDLLLRKRKPAIEKIIEIKHSLLSKLISLARALLSHKFSFCIKNSHKNSNNFFITRIFA